MITVRKRDGRLVPYNRIKLVNLMKRVGVPDGEAEALADQIDGWLPGVATDNVVEAQDIRKKLLTLLSPQVREQIRSYVKAKKG